MPVVEFPSESVMTVNCRHFGRWKIRINLRRKKMNRCKQYGFMRMAAFTSILLFLVSFQEVALAAIVNFETVPTLATGPSLYLNAGPAQTINVPGVATFSGGVVLGFPTNFPASPFSTPPNVYGTENSSFGADPSLKSSLSISIAPTFNTTTVEGLLFNGLTQPANYTIDAYSGSTLVDSVYFANLQSNFDSGFSVFRLNSGGPSISSVFFTPDTTTTSGQWNYVIDTVAIGERIENVSPVPIPASAVLFATGLMGLAGMRRLWSTVKN